MQLMGDKPSINETAKIFALPPHKVRKLLITGGFYDTEVFRQIRSLKEEGKSLEEIGNILLMKPATVRTYLPYERVIYNLEERSVNAERLQRFKERHGGYKAKDNTKQ